MSCLYIFAVYECILLFYSSVVKKDTAAEMAKKRELERQRLEKLSETSRLGRYRRRSRSRSRSYSRSPRYLLCCVFYNILCCIFGILVYIVSVLRY